MKRLLEKLVLITGLLLTACVGTLCAQERVRLDLRETDGVQLVGYFTPNRVNLSFAAPTTIGKVPKLKSPQYGALSIDGERTYYIILDGMANGKPKLYVDANGDGDLTNEPSVKLTVTKDSKGYRTWKATATLTLVSGETAIKARFGFIKYDPENPALRQFKDTIMYYADYAYSGKATIGEKSYDVALLDVGARGNLAAMGSMLHIDRNGDGTFDPKWERFDVTMPFFVDGQSWALADVSPLGGEFSIVKSDVAAEELKEPHNNSVGQTITNFTATDLDGGALSFPGDFAGKIVLLDFWATWCGPCVGEIPGLASAYKKYSPNGFDVLGISLDNENQDKQIRSFMKQKNMVWREVYDGKGWGAEIGQLFKIRSIPASYLVDGDTGEILAKTDSLRGTNLAPTIEAALKKKGKL